MEVSFSESNHTVTMTFHKPCYSGETALMIAAELKKISPRLLIIRSAGKNFCTGADLNWMALGPGETKEQSEKEMRKIFTMYEAFLSLSCPVIALINGKVRGGGVGIVSVSDYAIALDTSDFALPEKKLGLIPGIIAPLVRRKIGEENYRLLEGGETLSPETARHLGLIQEVVTSFPEDLPSVTRTRVPVSQILSEMEKMLILSAEKRRQFRRA